MGDVTSLGAQMKSFHENKVRLSIAQQDEMRNRRNAGRTRFEKGADRDGSPRQKEFRSQGSYAMHTMIQDPDNDYDIDDGVYFNSQDLESSAGVPLTPFEVKSNVCSALVQDSRLNQPAAVMKNCVRQHYPDGYHIDIPVYKLTTNENSEEICELAGEFDWVLSDGRRVTQWFKDVIAAAEQGDQLRRCVSLTKAFSRSRKEWKAKTCSGILITKLIVENFACSNLADDVTLYAVWQRVLVGLINSTRVEHPVNPDLLSDENDMEVGEFLINLKWAMERLNCLASGCSLAEAADAWNEVFNTDFFEAPNDGGAKKSIFVMTDRKSDTRDDNGGRYGSV